MDATTIDIQPPVSPLEMSSSSVDDVSNRNSDSVSCSDECLLWSDIEPVKLNNHQIYVNSDDDDFGDVHNDLSELIINGHVSNNCDSNGSPLYIEAKNDVHVSELNHSSESSSNHMNGKDYFSDFLDKCNDTAEARLAAKRQARAEAREIRMRELERQQREQEENADRVYDMYTDPVTRNAAAVRLTGSTRNTMLSNSSYMSSRRSSEDSLEDSGTLRDVRHELREIEEKFRKAMIANAQLDNDKASYTYQIELLKDKLEDLEQDHIQLQREHRDKCREHEQLKRAAAKLKEDLLFVKTQLEERDMLIAEKGLVIVVCEENGLNGYDDADHNTSNGGGGNGDASENSNVMKPKKALVSVENAELLESAGEGSLDVRLKRFIEEKKELEDQVRSLRIELDEERNKSRRRRPSSNTSSTIGNTITHNGPDSEYFSDLDVIDVQREANKQLADYKFKLQKAEQDIATLQGTVARLETQVVRYRAEAEASERAEDELKTEKRKLQREARESQNRVEELETANSHLQKRLDKLKNAKSTLLKEL